MSWVSKTESDLLSVYSVYEENNRFYTILNSK